MINLEIAKTWYQDSDTVHNFDHILRVYRLAEKIAENEGANLKIVRAAVLLHDAEGSDFGESALRVEHHEISAAFAKQILEKEQWGRDDIARVQECILSHRFRSKEIPQTIEAKVVFDADKLDAIGAVGAARAIAYAALDNKPFFALPSEMFSRSYKLEVNELHSAYHEYIFKLKNIKDRLYTRSAIEIANSRHSFMAKFFLQLEEEYLGHQ